MTAPAEWTERDSINLTAQLIADGHRLPVRGRERAAAIAEMAARGVDLDVMAARLCVSRDAIRLHANRYGVKLPDPPPQPWWVAYVEPSAARGFYAEVRRQRRRERRATTRRDGS